MKKALLIATATAFLGSSTLASTPAHAVFLALPLFLAAKVDPYWGPKKAEPKKAVKVAKHKKSKKKKM